MSCSFTYRLEGDIKRYMNGHSDKEKAAGTVLKEERQQNEAVDSTCRLNIKRASQQR